MKLIRTSGKVEEFEGTSLESWQKAVGGYIETIPVEDGMLIINEEGKLKGLPINYTANLMAEGWIMPTDYIVGDVIFMTQEEASKIE